MLVLELQERILCCKEKCMGEVKASTCTAIAMRANIGRIIGEMARRLPANTLCREKILDLDFINTVRSDNVRNKLD